MKRHRWVWVLIFILAVLLLGTLATGWNVVLIQRMRDFELRTVPRPNTWLGIVLGTLGFVGLLGGMILFFVRLLQEMRLNQLQSEFIATVSHELKTPLATLELSSSLIRAGGLTPEEEQRLWHSHETELRRLKDEVESLLEAAQWQSNAMQPRNAPIVLEEWITQSMERWTNILGPEGVLTRQGPPLECEAVLDPRLLGRIIDNLLDNARKFARGQPRVILRTSLGNGGWEIAIQDQGWGFDPSDSERMFKRFVRVRTDAPYAISGTGLGLHLAQIASRAIHVKLSAESAGQGKGATFRIQGKCR